MKQTVFYYLILACILLLVGCGLDDPQVGISATDVINLSVRQPTLLADGQSKVVLTATLGPESDANRSVTFFSEQGTFQGKSAAPLNEITLVASGKTAEVILISDTQVNEDVSLSAKVTAENGDNFLSLGNIAFTRAFPDRILFKADRTTINADRSEAAVLTVDLFRDGGNGTPSDEALVEFSVAPVDTSTATGDIVDFVFTDGTTATTTLRSLTDSTGVVRVTATTEGNGGPLSKTLDIEFQ